MTTGNGSVSSPGSAEGAITAAAVTKSDIIAPFSSGGPTPVSLEMKPDVSAPGVAILSSVPPRVGLWSEFSGTSMASPHVAGAAALLLQRHPGWTVEQIKSALVLTGKPVLSGSKSVETPTTREGGGLIYLPTANDSADLRRADRHLVRARQGGDAGDADGPAHGRGRRRGAVDGVRRRAGPDRRRLRHRPGERHRPRKRGRRRRTSAASAKEADVTGFVVLAAGHGHAPHPVLAAQRASAAREADRAPAEGRHVQGQHASWGSRASRRIAIRRTRPARA